MLPSYDCDRAVQLSSLGMAVLRRGKGSRRHMHAQNDQPSAAVTRAVQLKEFGGPEALAVREIPRSGKPDELLDRFGISARHVVEAVRSLVGAGTVTR